jgi:hypothetical protein
MTAYKCESLLMLNSLFGSRYKSKGTNILLVNAVVATVLGSIPASSDTVEYEGRQTKQC